MTEEGRKERTYDGKELGSREDSAVAPSLLHDLSVRDLIDQRADRGSEKGIINTSRQEEVGDEPRPGTTLSKPPTNVQRIRQWFQVHNEGLTVVGEEGDDGDENDIPDFPHLGIDEGVVRIDPRLPEEEERDEGETDEHRSERSSRVPSSDC